MCRVYIGILELCPSTVLALCFGMIVSGWLVGALRLRSLGVVILGLASALVKMPSGDALSIKRADASWRACEFCSNQRSGREKLLLERRSELLRSIRGKTDEDVKEATSQSKRALEVVAAVSPPKVKCKECGQACTIVQRVCSGCGAENVDFSSELDGIYRSGKRSGWKANAGFMATIKRKNSEERQAAKDVGELLTFLRTKRLFADSDGARA